MNKPFLHIGQEYWESKMNYEVRDKLIENSSPISFISTIIGSKHPDFIDFPLIIPKRIQKMLKQNENFGTMNPRYVYRILNDLQLNFFDSFVKLSSNFNYKQLTQNYQVLQLTVKKPPNS